MNDYGRCMYIYINIYITFSFLSFLYVQCCKLGFELCFLCIISLLICNIFSLRDP